MPGQRHYYGENHLHYVTANIYRRARIFDADRFKLKFAQTLGELRAELAFRIIGPPQSCKTRAGAPTWRLALVELALLLSGRQLDSRDG
jgi:hypothetical protein